MKIGLAIYGSNAYIHSGGNEVLAPGDAVRMIDNDYCSTNCWNTFPKMYPDDIYATINIAKPDLDICSQLDAVIYYTSTGQDPQFIKVIEDVPCAVIFRQDAGYQMMSEITKEEILRNKRLMDLSDAVLTSNFDSLLLYKAWTDTPVFWSFLPYPVRYALDCINESNDLPRYDIVVAYSPTSTVHTKRNGIVAAMIAQRIVDAVEGYSTVGIVSKSANDDQIASDQRFLYDMGCKNCEMIPRTLFKQYLQVVSKAKLFINLDRNDATGKAAVDCALAKTPVIISDTLPYARYIYGDIAQEPYDINAALSMARMVMYGEWSKERTELAYQRALEFSIPKIAERMRGIIQCVKR